MNPLLTNLITFSAGAILAALLFTPLIRRWAVSIECVSRPTQDRWGRRVIARLGGIPIAVCFLAAVAWGAFQDARLWGLLAGGILMTAVGLIDDLRRLHPYSKLIAQMVAGCLIVLGGIQIELVNAWLAIPFTIAWLVLIMNAFNLMDNMDGLSAGIGAIAAGFCAWHAYQAGDGLVAIMSVTLMGVCVGFLRYNLPPAKIFMGDTGSQVLGLGLGALALMRTWHHSAQLIGILALPTLLLAVPIFDTLFVTFQRITHGRHPFQGGTDHLSHRLGVLGLSTRQIVFFLYSLSAAFGGLSVLIATQKPLGIVVTWLLGIGALLLVGGYLAKVRVYSGPDSLQVSSNVTWIDTMLLHKKRISEVVVDFVLVFACYVAAHALRFEANLTPDLESLILKSLPWVITVKMVCFFGCGLYRGVWRYISLPDLSNILRAVVMGSVLSALVVLFLWRFEGYSRSVFIIDGTLLFLAISGARLFEPLVNEWLNTSVRQKTPILIVGAGDTGELLVQQIKLERSGNRRVIGFLDDDLSKQGDRIHGIPILGTRRDLGRIVQQLSVQELYIAIRRPPDDLVRQIQGYAEENGLAWMVVSPVASAPQAPPAPR